MSGEATRRAPGRFARFAAWRSGLVPHGRGLRTNNRGIGWAHGIVLALGILVILFGLYLLATLQFNALPTIATFFIGVSLVIIGLFETLFEAEERRIDRRYRR